MDEKSLYSGSAAVSPNATAEVAGHLSVNESSDGKVGVSESAEAAAKASAASSGGIAAASASELE